jgi:hypothetical protein
MSRPISPPGDETRPLQSSKKRSSEHLNDAEDIPPSSKTMVGDSSSQQAEIARMVSTQPSMEAHNKTIPLPPLFNATSRATPPSGQGHAGGQSSSSRTMRSDETSKPSVDTTENAQKDHNGSDDSSNSSSSTISPATEPDEKIVDFDWIDLEQRYHDKMHELDDKEDETFNQFSALIQACVLLD